MRGRLKQWLTDSRSWTWLGAWLGRLQAPNQMPASVGIEEGLFLDIT